MKFAKRLLMVSGAVMLAGIVGVLLTPKALHAVATLVQVANDAAHPVLTASTDNHARTAVLLSADVHILDGQNSGGGPFHDANGSYTVPAGQRLVIESISQNFVAPTGQKASLFILYQLNGLQGLVDLVPVFVTTDGGLDQYESSIAFTTYADPGTQITFEAFRSPFTSGAATFHVSLAGHLESIQ